MTQATYESWRSNDKNFPKTKHQIIDYLSKGIYVFCPVYYKAKGQYLLCGCTFIIPQNIDDFKNLTPKQLSFNPFTMFNGRKNTDLQNLFEKYTIMWRNVKDNRSSHETFISALTFFLSQTVLDLIKLDHHRHGTRTRRGDITGRFMALPPYFYLLDQ